MKSGAPSVVAGLTAAMLMTPGAEFAQVSHSQRIRPILPGSLGTLHHAIRTAEPAVQTLMNEGLTLYYGFNRDAARGSFLAATRLDPDAAMVRAGLALALGPNLNMESSPSEIKAACESAKLAVSLSKSVEEGGYSNALVVRYCDPDGSGRLNA